MQEFTDRRGVATRDELWLVQHPPVYTLGLNGRQEHVHDAADIPVIPIDRGGQVTYHGPGQIVAYPLLDLRRLGIGIRQLVTALEDAVIELLADYQIEAMGSRTAPGVYVQGAKIAALGLRVRRGGCYHGLSLNVEMDLTPFARINPCGFPGLAVTQLSALHAKPLDLAQISRQLAEHISRRLGYTISYEHGTQLPV